MSYTAPTDESAERIRDLAGNAAAFSQESVTNNTGALQEPPAAPDNLEAVENADGSVTLSWDAPDDDSITGYQILRREPDAGEDSLSVLMEDTGSTATNYTDADVTAGALYVYRVKAINDAGVGEQSRRVRITTSG